MMEDEQNKCAQLRGIELQLLYYVCIKIHPREDSGSNRNMMTFSCTVSIVILQIEQ